MEEFKDNSNLRIGLLILMFVHPYNCNGEDANLKTLKVRNFLHVLASLPGN